MQIKALNTTHYAFTAAPASRKTEVKTVAYAPGDIVSWGFTGVILGVYATTNGYAPGGANGTAAYVSNWKYGDLKQVRA